MRTPVDDEKLIKEYAEAAGRFLPSPDDDTHEDYARRMIAAGRRQTIEHKNRMLWKYGSLR